MTEWLLLHYKLPGEPSASRVYIWRKLKRLGALFYQDAVWVLPDTPRHREQYQWLAAEILEMGGEAALWMSRLALGESEDSLTQRFTDLVDKAYAEILDALDHAVRQAGVNLESLARQYQHARSRDYFQSDLGKRVYEALLAARGVQK